MSAMVLVWVLNFGRKDTPVLMANTFTNNTNRNPFKISNAKSLAVAAAMPIVAVPIQDVQLLDYAVAHETVNAGFGLTASVDDDIYLGLLDKDPYTSDQQRERDEYEINDTDWNEVVFEEVYGGSTAKLALHNDWINQKGYEVDAVVNLNLPEQGINGPFRITSIKHILPQKKPIDDDETDEYDYRPVTALFTHESNQVYNIDFDNGEKLGVTYQHPIYSTTAGDWKLAGELEIGEEVLTKSGNIKVVNSVHKDGSETVYNLEVKELHNFLVGESGIVVHNSYSCVNRILKKIVYTLRSKTYVKIGTKEQANLLGAKALGLTKEADWISFAQAVSSKNVSTLEGLGFTVKSLPNGSLSVINANKRYRTPILKAQTQKVSSNIEVKPDNLTWNNIDASAVNRDKIAYNNIEVEYPDI